MNGLQPNGAIETISNPTAQLRTSPIVTTGWSTSIMNTIGGSPLSWEPLNHAIH